LLRSAVHVDGFHGHRFDTGYGVVRLPDLGKQTKVEK
jgi:hypothetical protein